MLYSRSCEYAIQTMLYVAIQPQNRLVLVRDIAARVKIPAPFLAKIVQSLVKNGFLRSQKGRKGGVCLARSPEDIKLIDIVAIIDTLTGFNRCVLGFSVCDESNWCPVHEPWSKMRETIRSYFEQKSLADLAQESRLKLERSPELHRIFFE